MNRRIMLGAALLAAALLLGLVVMAGWLTWFDVPIMRRVALTDASPSWLSSVAMFLTRLGDPDLRSGGVVLVCVAFIARHCWRSAAVYLATVIVAIGGHSYAKIAYARPRPRLTPWLDHVVNLSYPSGHAAGAMVILLGAALLTGDRWLRWPALALALAIGASRPLLGVHWPTDVVGGALWGAGFALIGAGVAQALGFPRPRLFLADRPVTP